MDEPFRKRPRLSMFADDSSNTALDQDLDSMRYRNDFLLKSRFESIFEKYSKDFTGIGDEIDLETGEIIVDNGHLHSITTETDTGMGNNVDTGKAFLKAMTVDQDPEDPYYNEGADNVLMSIEEIAENAFNGQSDTQEDSEDDLFPAQSLATPPDSRGHDTIEKSDFKSESDTESLFDVKIPLRDSSPDSLFEAYSTADNVKDFDSQPETAELMDSALSSENDQDSVILARYGEHVGTEVIDMLRRERAKAEAHIEPAWRIPSNIIPPKALNSLGTSSPLPSMRSQSQDDRMLFATTSQPKRSESLEIQKSFSRPPSEPLESLWKAPGPTRIRKVRRPAQRCRTKRILRADSADPLQDGFVSDHPEHDDVEASGSEYEAVKKKWRRRNSSQESLDNEDEQIKSLQQGVCAYCGRQYKTRAGVISHWANLAEKFETRGEIDNVHDITYLRAYRQKVALTTTRTTRLVLSDFRTMVELHEGAGLTFAEIADCGALRTKKTGPGLADVYDRYRTAPVNKPEPKEWSSEELAALAKLCENPIRDMSTFAKTRQLNGRSHFEIAGKLAEIWLNELQKSIRRPKSGDTVSTSHKAIGGVWPAHVHRRGSTEDPLFIKEECDD
ncbi:hypothetical protein LTR84_012764 [Exophiala bonariae]|uniref:C2H2-type domain-containing protein n=1 Tax=Exophiala bonariae TaxID=1690606 RepID=A0AAV9NHJ6_9EURO|nr:hypothetical protein LTR84_012764 [Exophiala bonariae]